MTDAPFTDHPLTIGEIRSGRSRLSADWTPREALVAAIRQIDEGKIKPDMLIVCVRDTDEDQNARYFHSSPDGMATLGLLDMIRHLIVSRRIPE